MGYYRNVNGRDLDARLLEMAEKAVAGAGDGRISRADAEKLLAAVKDANAYTDIEKETMAYIRDHFQWTESADAWFRTEISRWAATK